MKVGYGVKCPLKNYSTTFCIPIRSDRIMELVKCVVYLIQNIGKNLISSCMLKSSDAEKYPTPSQDSKDGVL